MKRAIPERFPVGCVNWLQGDAHYAALWERGSETRCTDTPYSPTRVAAQPVFPRYMRSRIDLKKSPVTAASVIEWLTAQEPHHFGTTLPKPYV